MNKKNRISYLIILIFSNLISILLTYLILTIDFKELFKNIFDLTYPQIKNLINHYFEYFNEITSDQTIFTSDQDSFTSDQDSFTSTQDKITSAEDIDKTLVTENINLKSDINSIKSNKFYWILGISLVIAASSLFLWYNNYLIPIDNTTQLKDVIIDQGICLNELQEKYYDLLFERDRLIKYREAYYRLFEEVYLLEERVLNDAERIDAINRIITERQEL